MENGMKLENPALIKSREQIDWVLSHPGMSPWLKTALATVRDRDPNDVLNDLEVLNHVLRSWCKARVHTALEPNTNKT
jgi:hypothetical protein